MLYLANPSTQRVRDAMTAGRLGCIVTPKQGNGVPPRALWCADNGCGPGAGGGPGKGWPGDEAFADWIREWTWDDELMARCLFAVAPDVVADAAATMVRFERWGPHLRDLGYPVALAAQNGLEDMVVPWGELDVLFLGGDTEWKLGPAAAALAHEAKRRGKRVHMGRVNSARRFARAQLIGCDWADGGFIRRGPDTNLPKALRWGGPDVDLLTLLTDAADSAAPALKEAAP